MSWQTYVDDHIVKLIDCKAAVLGSLADGSIWAHYETTPAGAITAAELKIIVDQMRSDPKQFQANGIHIGGEKYICLFAEDKLLRGRKGTSCMVVVATNTVILAALSNDGFPPGQLNNVVEKLGDYLRNNNF